MQEILIAHLTDVSIRSLLLALFAGAVLWTFRASRNAALSHAVWSLVLAGMLLLPALVPSLPPLRVFLPDRLAPIPPPQTGQVFPGWSGWLQLAFWIYAAVAAVLLLRVAVGAVLVGRLLRGCRAVEELPGILECEAIAVPLTVGWVHPRILLPRGWREWDRNKLDAVLAHEAAHARRRDPLVTLLAATNRAVLWFHPLAWWIERRLSLLAEQACDDASLAVVGDRERYARLLLQMAGEVEDATLWHAVSMAKQSHLRQRIETILDGSRAGSRSLRRSAIAAVLLCSLPVIFATAALRLEQQPPLLALPFRPLPTPPPPASTAPAQRVMPPSLHRSQAELELAILAQKESDPRRKLQLLDDWKTRYPHSGMESERLQLYLNTYSQLNDVPNLLTALNQMGKEAFVKALHINPDRAEVDFSPANLYAGTHAQARVSQALFFYARAATYEGPGSLPVEGRQQLDEYLRKAYSSYYGQNDVGLNELKNLAKAMPFPPQAFLISVLPPPNRTFNSMLAAETSLIRIRNKCPYGLRIDCNGPERKRTWIPSGQDSQLVVAPGTYQIYAADIRGVSSFTGPGRFDPQFDYAYTLTVEQGRSAVPPR